MIPTAGRTFGVPDSLRLVARVSPRILENVCDTSIEVDEEPTAPLAAAPARIELPAPAAREVAVGVTLRSRYVLEQIIGQGGDSIVFRAVDLHRTAAESGAGDPVAIKVLRPEHRLNSNSLRRLKRQFQQMQALAHPGIARVFDLDRDGDIWFISMELVAGETVNRWTQKSTHLSQAVSLISACCEALEHAHSRGILHGDLKPSNVLVAEDGSVKLIDFGSAPSAGPGTDVGHEPSTAATMCYASPQIIAGSTAEERDDIFSLACLSYVILSKGRRPFEGNCLLGADRPAAHPPFVPDIPVRLYEVVLRGLAAERDLRPSSVREFLHELNGADLSRLGNQENVPSPIHVAASPAQPWLLHSQALVPVPSPTSGRQRHASGTWTWLAERRAGLIGLVVIMISAAVVVGQAMQRRTGLTHAVQHSVPAKSLAPVSTATRVGPVQASTAPPAVSAGPPGVNLKARASGTITFESSTMNVTEGQSLVAIPIKRLRAMRGSGSVAWTIEGGTALPGVDYAPVDAEVVKLIQGQSVRSIFIPLLQRGATANSGSPRTLIVALHPVAGGPALGPVSRITVTISPLEQRTAH